MIVLMDEGVDVDLVNHRMLSHQIQIYSLMQLFGFIPSSMQLSSLEINDCNFAVPRVQHDLPIDSMEILIYLQIMLKSPLVKFTNSVSNIEMGIPVAHACKFKEEP